MSPKRLRVRELLHLGTSASSFPAAGVHQSIRCKANATALPEPFLGLPRDQVQARRVLWFTGLYFGPICWVKKSEPTKNCSFPIWISGKTIWSMLFGCYYRVFFRAPQKSPRFREVFLRATRFGVSSSLWATWLPGSWGISAEAKGMGDSSACPVFLCYVNWYDWLCVFLYDSICILWIIYMFHYYGRSGAQWCSSYPRHSRSE